MSFCYVKRKLPRKYYEDDALLSQVGENIRNTRIAKDMSIESLANECELDYSQISRIELGKVNFSISHLYKITKALEIDPKNLLP